MYELCSLKPAFHSFNCDGIMKKIKSGKVPAMPAEYSQPLRQLVRSMMYTDESKRPTAEEILNMPFLQVLLLLMLLAASSLSLICCSLMWHRASKTRTAHCRCSKPGRSYYTCSPCSVVLVRHHTILYSNTVAAALMLLGTARKLKS